MAILNLLSFHLSNKSHNNLAISFSIRYKYANTSYIYVST